MSIEELQAIIGYARVQPDQPVRIDITFSGGTKQLCDILSYNTYTDGIVLNVAACNPDE